MDIQERIDHWVDIIVKGRTLRTGMTWEEKKNLMLSENPLITESKLEELKPSILRSFKDQWMKQIQKDYDEEQAEMNEVTNHYSNDKTASELHPKTLASRPPTPPKSYKLLDSSSSSGFHPKIDSTVDPDGVRYMSVFNPHTNEYTGASFEYCCGSQSYASTSWVEQRSLKPAETHTWFDWFPANTRRHFTTKFIVIDIPESFDCDFLLGSKCKDPDFNRKETGIRVPVSTDETVETESGGLQTRNQVIYELDVEVDVELAGKLIFDISKRSAAEKKTRSSYQQQQQYLISPPGGRIESEGSVSSAGGGTKRRPSFGQ